jgi:excisionase family DNA binding protein
MVVSVISSEKAAGLRRIEMAHATEMDPTDQDIREAARALEPLELGEGDLVRGLTLMRSHSVSGEHADVTVTVTESVGRLLLHLLAHLADGDGAVLVGRDRELTTQQAADLLNVSRPHVVKLIKEGKLQAHKVGTHHRIGLHALLAYKRGRDADAHEALSELVAHAQELGLGYGCPSSRFSMPTCSTQRSFATFYSPRR